MAERPIPGLFDDTLNKLHIIELRGARPPINELDRLHELLFKFAKWVPQIKLLTASFIYNTLAKIGLPDEFIHRYDKRWGPINISLGTDLEPAKMVVPDDLLSGEAKRLYLHDVAHFEQDLGRKINNPELMNKLFDYLALADLSLSFLTREDVELSHKQILLQILTDVFQDLPQRPEYQPARLEMEELRYLFSRLFQLPSSYSLVSLPNFVKEFRARNQFIDKNLGRLVEATVQPSTQFFPPVEVDVGGICVILRNLLSDVAGNPVSDSGPIPAIIDFSIKTEGGRQFLIMYVMNEGYLYEKQLEDIGRVPIVASDGKTLRGWGKVSNTGIWTKFLEHCKISAKLIRGFIEEQWKSITLPDLKKPFVRCQIPFAAKST